MTKPTPKDRPPGRALGKAETELWRQVTGDVDPLPETHDLADHAGTDPAAPPSDPPSDKPPNTSSAESGDADPPPPVDTSPPPPLRPEPVLTHVSAPGLDRRTEINLRRGKVGIQARIDLHGMTQEQAHRALGDFLADQQAAGRRSVLVITGKGAGGTGILREAVPQWLNQDANRKRIRAFSHAQPKDGGEGALYVLLKRLK